MLGGEMSKQAQIRGAVYPVVRHINQDALLSSSVCIGLSPKISFGGIIKDPTATI